MPFGGSRTIETTGRLERVRWLERSLRERPRRLRRRRPRLDPPGGVPSWRLPILRYERSVPAANGASAVSLDELEQQLRYLRDAGFRSCRLDEWHAAVAGRRPLPGRPVLLTFDGACREFVTDTWPLLRGLGFTAAVFLRAGEIGGHPREGEAPGAALLDWPVIRRLAEQGVEWGSSSPERRPLTGLPLVEVVRELASARAALQGGLGRGVTAFAYPCGETDPALGHLVGACGYTYAVTTGGAVCTPSDGLLALPRIPIDAGTGLERLVDALRAAGTA
jgi:peptidoglycan/xylan/chitin deacetylase (PgdA/CDA1 family)